MSYINNDSFLASVLLKLIRSEPVGAEEVSRLQLISDAANMVVSDAVLEVPESPTPSAPASPVLVKKTPKKIKTLEAAPALAAAPAPAPAPAPFSTGPAAEVIPAAAATATAATAAAAPFSTGPAEAVTTAVPETTYISYIRPSVDLKHCVARKIDDKSLVLDLPGTAKVFHEKQCVRKPLKGEPLCAKCKEFQIRWSEGKDTKCKDWKGLLADTPLDCLQVVGSAWFQTTFPAVRPAGALEAVGGLDQPKLAEAVLKDTQKVQEVRWATIKLDGVHYIYNLKDRRMYKADITQTGEDQIMWDHFEGKWRNGEIDYYAEENEDDCYDD